MFVDSSERGSPSRGVLAAGIALVVGIWAANFIAAKIGLRDLPPLALASFRVVLAGLVMIPVYLLRGHLPALTGPQARSLRAQELWTFTYLGFFGVVVNQLCFTTALRYTSVSHAAVIVGMGPIYVLVLAVLFGLERPTLRKVAGMLVAFLGVAILAAEKGITTHSPSLFGDALSMCGSLGFAMYAVLGKRVAGRYDPITMTALNHFTGALIVLPLAVLEARGMYRRGVLGQVRPEAWAAVAFMAVCASAVAYILYYWMLRYLEASQLAAFTYLLPVLATVLGIVLLAERASWGQLAGGLVAMAGVYCIESGRS